MISRHPPLLLLSLCLCICNACSPAAFDPQDDPVPLYSFELFLSRTASTGAEFEHYKVLPMGLYTECGFFRRGKPVVVQQGILTIPSERRMTLGRGVLEVSTEIASATSVTFIPPGKNLDVFDPGKFLLTITSGGNVQHIETSLDDVKEGSREVDAALRRITELTRGVPALPPCKNEEFFGLSRRVLGDE